MKCSPARSERKGDTPLPYVALEGTWPGLEKRPVTLITKQNITLLITMNHDPSGLDKWISQLGVTNAPVPRAGVQTALDFFYRYMPELPRSLRLAFLRAMDLSKPVKEVTLVSQCVVAAFRKCNEDPFKLFYTKPGTGMDRSGLNPSDRQFIRYRLIRTAAVLESRCAPALDTWTDDRHYFQAGGGAIQYIIPESYRYLEIG